MRIFYRVFLIIFLLGSARNHAFAFQVQSGPEQVSLVELYSSEGCSSCPPAERWFSGLRKDKRLWKEFVPVAFHVDYWDYIGWKDRFASAEFSNRQRGYAKKWNARSVYTPGLVLNGKEWQDWRRHNSVPGSGSNKVGILSVEKTDRFLRVTFEPESINPLISGWTANIALLGMSVPSHIRSGENAGKKLKHDFLVLEYQKQKMKLSGERVVAEFPIELLSSSSADQHSLAAWVSFSEDYSPVQAVGLTL